MMKLIWNLDNSVAIPLGKVEDFTIEKRDEGSWFVVVHYGERKQRVFVDSTKAKCINFIDNMEGYL